MLNQCNCAKILYFFSKGYHFRSKFWRDEKTSSSDFREKEDDVCQWVSHLKSLSLGKLINHLKSLSLGKLIAHFSNNYC